MSSPGDSGALGRRTSGLLLHPTCLPGPHGIGDLGPSAHRFVDFLAAAGQGLWQVLPLGPTGYGDSPYQTLSAFAGNPLLISLDALVAAGWLHNDDTTPPSSLKDGQVVFEAVIPWKHQLLDRAFDRFEAGTDDVTQGAFEAFCRQQQAWLGDFALFVALKGHFGGALWTQWPEDVARRAPRALEHWRRRLDARVRRQQFGQFLFFQQWRQLRAYAHRHGVQLVGDIPIFVAHDSADVWAHPQWFELDSRGEPTVVAGVPPDYFSVTGQRWGNPLYRWPVLARENYSFWVDRLAQTLNLVDIVRIDHFRGFAGYWEIDAQEPTAVNGRWQPGPGRDLFDTLTGALGPQLPLIAEDLGLITADVVALRETLDLPGMAVLQFAFEGDGEDDATFGDRTYLPHRHRSRLVVYTGTHDNDTTAGWWRGQTEGVRHRVRRYLNTAGEAIGRDFIRAALGSVAQAAIFPVQDLLNMGSEACLNRPGVARGNWTWRLPPGHLTREDALWLKGYSELYGRHPYPKA
ncbi:MAG: 4-alpha-glucanotransferase [Candidatus Competibacterales bacterium]